MAKKLDASGFDTDKSELYLNNYEYYFKHIADEKIRLLELGIDKGGSLLLWRYYFINGIIVGLDINKCKINDPTGRIHTYQGYQQDYELLDRIADEATPEGFA